MSFSLEPAPTPSNDVSQWKKWANLVRDAIRGIYTDLASSLGASLVGFIQSGTGAEATTVQAILRLFVIPEMYGAVGDGSTDDTAAFQDALNDAILNGKNVLLCGLYKITKASGGLTLNDTGLIKNYVLQGQGYGTGLVFTGFTSEFACFVNQDSGGTVVQSSYQKWPRVIVQNMKLDGSGSTNVSIFKTYKRGVICRELHCTGIDNLVTTNGASTDHTDQSVFENILWESGSTSNYMYVQGQFGDNPIIRNIQVTPVDGRGIANISNAMSAIVEGCINGIFKFTACTNLAFKNNHSEEYNNPTLTLNGCNGVISNNSLMNKDSPAILIGDDPNHYVANDLLFEDNRGFYSDGPSFDYALDNFIYIDFGASESTNTLRTNIRFRNNIQHCYLHWQTPNVFTQFGIKVGSAHIDINTLLALSNFGMYLSASEFTGLRYRNGAWEIYGDSWKVDEVTTAQQFSTQPTRVGYTSTPIANGTTYQYAVACYGQNGVSTANVTSSSVTTTNTNQAIHFAVNNVIPNTFIRVWRDTASAGTYAEYADFLVGDIREMNFVDRGNTVNGTTWLGSAPARPTLNEYSLYQTLASNTIQASGVTKMRLGLTGAGTVSSIVGSGIDGQQITFTHTNANTTWSFTATPSANNLVCKAHSGATWNASAEDTLIATYSAVDGFWYCIASS